MITEPAGNQPRPRKGRRPSATQQAQWQFQADLLDQLSDAVIAVDLDERITYLNRAAVAQYRVDPVGAIGQPLSYVHRYEWLQPEDELAATVALAEQGHWRGENRHIRQDGSTLHVESLVTELRDAEGNATGLLATIRDITDRKQVERNLRASELRYRRLADTLPQLVWTADITGFTDYYNIHIHDFDPAVWQGTTGFDWESLLHPADRAHTLAAWQQAVQQRRPYSCEHRLHMADGSWRWHLSRAQLMQDADTGLRWYGTATDIHDSKVAEEALRASRERLQLGVQVAGLVIAEVDYTTDQIYLDAAAATLYGLPADVGAVPRAAIHAVFHPDDAPEIFRRMVASFDPAGPGWFAMAHRVVHPDGAIRWLSVRKQVFFADDADGARRPIRALLAAFDITEQKVAEEALRASEERYRTLFETMEEGFCIFEMLYDEAGEPVDYRFLEVNPAFARFTGLENAVGKTAYELVPNLEPHWVAIYGAVARTGEAHHFTEGSAAMGRWFEVYAFRFGGPESRRVALLFNNITERKRTEDALRDNEARLQTILHNIPASIYMLTTDQRYLYVNRHYEQLANITNAEIQGKSIYDFFDPATAAALAANDQRALAAKAPLVLEEFAPQHGTIHTYASIKAPLLDAAGEPYALLGISTDITERKATEEALRTSEARFRTLANTVPSIIWTAAPDGTITYANDQWFEYCGLTPEENARQWPQLVLHPDDFDRCVTQWSDALARGEPYTIEVRNRRYDGVYRWFLTRAMPLHDAEGRITAWFGVTTDIDERKQAEQALHTSEERLRLATEAGGVGIFDHNLITNQTEISPIYAQITGLPLVETMPREQWLALVHPEDRSMVAAIWENARATGASYYYECRLLRPDDALVWIEVNAWVTTNEAGQGIRITGAIRDITERKQAALHQQFLLNLNSTLRTLTDAAAIQQTVVERLGQYLGVDRCRFNAIDLAADQSILLAAWSRAGLPPPRDVAPLSAHASAMYIANAQAGRTLVIQDADQDERDETAQAQLLMRGFAATIRVPCLREGQWVASLHLLQTTPRRWRADEVQLVESVVHHFWPLVEKARAETELRRQEEFLRQLADNVPGLIGYLDAEERYRFVNAAFEAWFQRPRHRIIGHTAAELIGEVEHHRLSRYRQQALAGERVNYETDFAYPDGVTRTVWGRYQPDVAADGRVLGFYLFLMDITARKQMEEALHASEARFRAVQQASPDGYMIFESVRDEQGAIIDFRWRYLNPASEQMVGRTQADLLGKRLLEEMPGNRAEGLFDAYVRVVETGEVYQREFCYQHEGIDRWFRNTAAKAGDGFAVAFSDITVRKQAEIALQQSNAILQGVLEGSNDAIFVRDLTGRYLLVNQAGADQVGLAQRAIIGRRYHEIFDAAIVAAITDDDHPVLTEGRVVTLEQVSAQQGVARYWHTLKMPLRSAAGEIIGLISSARDLTAHKAAEEALRLSEARYRTIFEHVGVSLWEEDFSQVKQVVDGLVAQWRAAGVPDLALAMRNHCAAHPDFVQAMLDRVHIVDVNEETARLYGRPKAELLRPFAQYFDAATLAHFVEQLVLLATGGQRYHFDGPITTPQGQSRHVAFTVVFPADADGDFTRVLLSGLDVTPLKAAEVENRRLLLETQSLLAQVQEGERFLQSIADTNPNEIYLFDLRTNRNRYANRQLAVTLGYTPTEAQTLGAPLIPTLLHPDDQAYLADHLAHLRALADGELAEWEYRMQHKSGKWCWLNSREIVFERDEQGRPLVILGTRQDITARKEAEVALRAGEARFRHLAEAMPQLVWVSAADGATTYINRQWLAYSGMTLAETLGEGMWPAIHPEDQAHNRAQWRHALASGEAYEGEVRLRRHDGVYRWFLERAIPVHDEAGVIQQWFGVSMDIHDRKAAEERQQFLSELGMDLRLLNDSETILAQLVSRLGEYLQVAGCRVNEVDLQREQFTLQKDWVAPDASWPAMATPGIYPLAELAPPALLAALQAGQTVVVSNTLQDPRTAPVANHYTEDQVRSLIGVPIFHQGEWRATLSVKDHGERHWHPDEVALLENVAGQLSSLLEKVRAEEALRASEEIARRQLAEIEAIYATAPVGLCLVDCDLRYVRINETLATINGSTIAEQLGRTLAETQPAAGYRIVEPLYRQVIATGIPLLHQEVQESHVDPAQARDWLVSYYPLKNGDGMVIGVNAVIVEITERKRAERQLQELNASLEERVWERTQALAQTNRELEQFTYAAAHDLRTPLRGIANLVQWISEDAAPVLPPDSQRHLEKLGGRVTRLEKMLEDLLAYSRVGRVRYLPEIVNGEQLIQNLLDLLAPPPGFVVQLTTPLPTFSALRIPLELLFRNLLSNAIRHHHDPAHGVVTISVRERGEWYEFCISDNGPGIDPQYHDRIFGMFQTLKPRDQVEGSGIGLALVKKMVESVGGRIWMESALGQGTQFYFTWPKGEDR